MFVLKIKLVLFKMWQTDSTEVNYFYLEMAYLSMLIITKAEKIYPCCWLTAVQNLKGKVFQPPQSLQTLGLVFFQEMLKSLRWYFHIRI